jgi:hypothetical protein
MIRTENKHNDHRKNIKQRKTPPISPHRNPVKENMFIADCSSQNYRE